MFMGAAPFSSFVSDILKAVTVAGAYNYNAACHSDF